MRIGDNYPYTFESGEQIAYQVCTMADLHEFLEGAKKRDAVVRHFDDPMRRVVGWCVGDQGRGVTIMELKDRRAAEGIPAWWWAQMRTSEGRAAIAERYSRRGA